MSASIAIVDTHIVVAGLLTAEAASPVAHILDGMLAARFQFALSETLLAEYRAALLRPRIRQRHRLTESDVDLLLTDLAENAIVATAAPSGFRAPDAKDQFLWDLLAARASFVLVTGDLRLARAGDPPGRVVSPAEFAGAQGPE
jgi:predicted nucleic acid-binding protein